MSDYAGSAKYWALPGYKYTFTFWYNVLLKMPVKQPHDLFLQGHLLLTVLHMTKFLV